MPQSIICLTPWCKCLAVIYAKRPMWYVECMPLSEQFIQVICGHEPSWHYKCQMYMLNVCSWQTFNCPWSPTLSEPVRAHINSRRCGYSHSPPFVHSKMVAWPLACQLFTCWNIVNYRSLTSWIYCQWTINESPCIIRIYRILAVIHAALINRSLGNFGGALIMECVFP